MIAKAATTDAGVEQSLRSSKIMIVDDEAYTVLVLKKLLAFQGYHSFVGSTDSTQAFNLIQQHRPDVLLLDIVMPQVSGIDILQQMQSDVKLSAIPVIVLTATADPAVRTQALKFGATDYLSKPIASDELLMRVRNVLAAKAHFDYLDA